jgi:hypothetical protein
MFKKKCRGCAEKVDRKFNYCPSCGASFKAGNEADFGMLGSSDSGRVEEELKLPFGVEKIMGSLVKQLEKQLGGMNIDEKTGMPKGFKIQIARGPMGKQIIQNNAPRKRNVVMISQEESERRAKLKRVNAESKVRRFGDVIVYEIKAPGLVRKEDIVITELETGIEIRAYSKDKCYVKVIPLKVEILGWKVDKERVFVEMKG